MVWFGMVWFDVLANTPGFYQGPKLRILNFNFLRDQERPSKLKIPSTAKVSRRTLQHVNDIENEKVEKAVPAHFKATKSGKNNLRMTPVMVVKSRNPWVRLHFERDFINKHHLVESGINRVL